MFTIARVLADIEVVNIVKFSIDRGDVLTMNDITQEYKHILEENNAADIVDNYKKHICSLLKKKIRKSIHHIVAMRVTEFLHSAL